jgi:hypothetical protein
LGKYCVGPRYPAGLHRDNKGARYIRIELFRQLSTAAGEVGVTQLNGQNKMPELQRRTAATELLYRSGRN